MGIEINTLETWLKIPNIEEILSSYAERAPNIFGAVTTIPLPHTINTRVRLPQVHYLQSNSEEDAILTCQVCHTPTRCDEIYIVFLVFFQLFATTWIQC